jgi:hypothetical protein
MSAHDPERTFRQLSHHGSVSGWARCAVGFKFRRDETIWSSAVTYKHGLASPELGEARAAQCFRMHKNVGRLGTAGQKAKPA